MNEPPWESVARPDWRAPLPTDIAKMTDQEELRAIRFKAITERDIVRAKQRQAKRLAQETDDTEGVHKKGVVVLGSVADIFDRTAQYASIRLSDLGYEPATTIAYGSVSVLIQAAAEATEAIDHARKLIEVMRAIGRARAGDREISSKLVIRGELLAAQLDHSIRHMLAPTFDPDNN